MLGLWDDDWVSVGDCEGDNEIVTVWLPVCDVLRVNVPLPVVDCELLGDTLPVPETVGVGVAEGVDAWLGDLVWEGVCHCETVCEHVRVRVALRDGVELLVPDDVVDGVRRTALI